LLENVTTASVLPVLTLGKCCFIKGKICGKSSIFCDTGKYSVLMRQYSIMKERCKTFAADTALFNFFKRVLQNNGNSLYLMRHTSFAGKTLKMCGKSAF